MSSVRERSDRGVPRIQGVRARVHVARLDIFKNLRIPVDAFGQRDGIGERNHVDMVVAERLARLLAALMPEREEP